MPSHTHDSPFCWLLRYGPLGLCREQASSSVFWLLATWTHDGLALLSNTFWSREMLVWLLLVHSDHVRPAPWRLEYHSKSRCRSQELPWCRRWPEQKVEATSRSLLRSCTWKTLPRGHAAMYMHKESKAACFHALPLSNEPVFTLRIRLETHCSDLRSPVIVWHHSSQFQTSQNSRPEVSNPIPGLKIEDARKLWARNLSIQIHGLKTEDWRCEKTFGQKSSIQIHGLKTEDWRCEKTLGQNSSVRPVQSSIFNPGIAILYPKSDSVKILSLILCKYKSLEENQR